MEKNSKTFLGLILRNKWILITGFLFGITSLLLTVDFFDLGGTNPGNMGICSACFIRDSAGFFGLHNVDKLSYLRPEIIGLVTGAFFLSLLTKKFKTGNVSSPVSRFVLGIVMMFGALFFLGCPLRMVLRLAGGDLNALVGLFGLIAGIFVAVMFKNRGTSLDSDSEETETKEEVMDTTYMTVFSTKNFEGFIFPVIVLFAFIAAIVTGKYESSTQAPVWLAFGLAFILGAVAFKARFCTVGAFRNAMFYKSFWLLAGVGVLFTTLLIGNIATGNFNLGFDDQPIAHSEHFLNFIGLFIVGWAATLLSGCPLRQLVRAGSGNINAVITLIGLFIGGGLAHTFSIATSPKGAADNTILAVILSLVILALVSIFKRSK